MLELKIVQLVKTKQLTIIIGLLIKIFNFTLENYRNRIPVDKYDFDGNYVCTYSSLSDASMELFNNLSGVCNISLCCKGESSQAYNYIWRFKMTI